MLHLTLLDGKPIRLNPDSLLLVEATPDTHIKLTNGEFFLVSNTIDEVEQQFIAYKQRIHQSPGFKP
jgi:flagellar protein FlbD